MRSIAAAGLVVYYAAAVSFHRMSNDAIVDALPAATCAVVAVMIV